jgi:hypothetical protein
MKTIVFRQRMVSSEKKVRWAGRQVREIFPVYTKIVPNLGLLFDKVFVDPFERIVSEQ